METMPEWMELECGAPGEDRRVTIRVGSVMAVWDPLAHDAGIIRSYVQMASGHMIDCHHSRREVLEMMGLPCEPGA